MIRPLLASYLIAISASAAEFRQIVNAYCIDFHDADAKKGGVDLDSILGEVISKHPDTWEAVVKQLNPRHMPPIG